MVDLNNSIRRKTIRQGAPSQERQQDHRMSSSSSMPAADGTLEEYGRLEGN